MTGPDDYSITVRGLHVRRGGRVILADLSAEFRRGVITGVLGPSGSGKTTLLRAIVGVQVVAGGTVSVLGDPAGAPALRRRVAYMTQAPSVYADLTVAENLRYFARVVGAAGSRVDATLGALSLGPFRDHLVRTLSGGERSRVSLGIALLGNPELLVLDEPTVGLDPVLRHDLWEHFHALAATGTTLLVSTHVMDEAERCDEVLLMRYGRVVAAGAPADLFRQTHRDNMEDAFMALVEAP